jgi:hypothetical protein
MLLISRQNGMISSIIDDIQTLCGIPPTFKKLTSYANGIEAPQPFFAKFHHSLQGRF